MTTYSIPLSTLDVDDLLVALGVAAEARAAVGDPVTAERMDALASHLRDECWTQAQGAPVRIPAALNEPEDVYAAVAKRTNARGYTSEADWELLAEEAR